MAFSILFLLIATINVIFVDGSEISNSTEFCFVHGECIEGSFTGMSLQKSDIYCLKYCQFQNFNFNSKITHFSFDPKTKICEMFSDCNQISTSDCPQCISGHVDCTYEACNQPGLCEVTFYEIIRTSTSL